MNIPDHIPVLNSVTYFDPEFLMEQYFVPDLYTYVTVLIVLTCSGKPFPTRGYASILRSGAAWTFHRRAAAGEGGSQAGRQTTSCRPAKEHSSCCCCCPVRYGHRGGIGGGGGGGCQAWTKELERHQTLNVVFTGV
jgi:hypothetical protein